MFNLKVLVVLLVSAFLVEGCELSLDKNRPGVFLQQFSSKKLVLDVSGGSVSFAEGSTIQGYCSSGFRNLLKNQQSYNQSFTNVTLLCQNGDIFYLSGDSLEPVESRYSLACYENQASFYIGPVDYCKKLGLVYGMNIDGTPIIFAEVCYDIENMEVDFIHFVMGERPIILGKQVDVSPNNITYQLQKDQLFTFAEQNLKTLDSALRAGVKKELPNYEKIAQYSFDDLTPVRSYAGRFRPFTDSFEAVNLIPLWSTLKSDNWKTFYGILEKLSVDGPIDIYAGTSKVVRYPADDGCYEMKNFTYKVDATTTETVPLQIWNYIKPRNQNISEVVVVGINSPFLGFISKSPDLFGTGNCKDTVWLDPFMEVRRMPALGYTFCVTVQEAAENLKGFPAV